MSLRLVIVIVFALVAGAARAQPESEPAGKAEARALLAEGNARYSAGDLQGALTQFRRAFELYPSPKLLVNTATCEEQLGRSDVAASDLDEFLRRYDRLPAPTDDERRLAVTARRDLERMRASLGRIEWPSAPPRATLDVDGETSWLVRWVKPGEHRVVQHVGSDEQRSTRTVALGEIVTLDFVADKATAAPVEKRRHPAWVAPAAAVGAIAVVGLAVGLGLGLGLRHADQPRGDKTVGFTF